MEYTVSVVAVNDQAHPYREIARGSGNDPKGTQWVLVAYGANIDVVFKEAEPLIAEGSHLLDPFWHKEPMLIEGTDLVSLMTEKHSWYGEIIRLCLMGCGECRRQSLLVDPKGGCRWELPDGKAERKLLINEKRTYVRQVLEEDPIRDFVVLFEPDVCSASVALCEQSALALVHSGLRQSFVSPVCHEPAGSVESRPPEVLALESALVKVICGSRYIADLLNEETRRWYSTGRYLEDAVEAWNQWRHAIDAALKAVAPDAIAKAMNREDRPLGMRWTATVDRDLTRLNSTLHEGSLGKSGRGLATCELPATFGELTDDLSIRLIELQRVRPMIEQKDRTLGKAKRVVLTRPIPICEAAKHISIRSDVLVAKLRSANAVIDEAANPKATELEDLGRCFPKKRKSINKWADQAYPAIE